MIRLLSAARRLRSAGAGGHVAAGQAAQLVPRPPRVRGHAQAPAPAPRSPSRTASRATLSSPFGIIAGLVPGRPGRRPVQQPVPRPRIAAAWRRPDHVAPARPGRTQPGTRASSGHRCTDDPPRPWPLTACMSAAAARSRSSRWPRSTSTRPRRLAGASAGQTGPSRRRSSSRLTAASMPLQQQPRRHCCSSSSSSGCRACPAWSLSQRLLRPQELLTRPSGPVGEQDHHRTRAQTADPAWATRRTMQHGQPVPGTSTPPITSTKQTSPARSTVPALCSAQPDHVRHQTQPANQRGPGQGADTGRVGRRAVPAQGVHRHQPHPRPRPVTSATIISSRIITGRGP